jgi:hypothetical protein
MPIGSHQQQRPLIERADLQRRNLDRFQRDGTRACGFAESPSSGASAPRRSKTKPRPNKSRGERPSPSQACGARAPARVDGSFADYVAAKLDPFALINSDSKKAGCR